MIRQAFNVIIAVATGAATVWALDQVRADVPPVIAYLAGIAVILQRLERMATTARGKKGPTDDQGGQGGSLDDPGSP